MKKVGFLIIGLIISISIQAQSVKEIENIIEKTGDIESYSVIKRDTLKHGAYEKKSKDGFLIKKGEYVNGKKNGLWTHYKSNNEIIAQGSFAKGIKEGEWVENLDGIKFSKGKYLQGKKIGKWEFYNLEGDLSMIYNYTSKKVDIYKENDALKSLHIEFKDGNGKDIKYDSQPLYIGGYMKLKYDINQLNNEATTPKTKYITVFKVDIEGKVKSESLMNAQGTEKDKKALEIIKKLEGWIPGTVDGRNVEMVVACPLEI